MAESGIKIASLPVILIENNLKMGVQMAENVIPFRFPSEGRPAGDRYPVKGTARLLRDIYMDIEAFHQELAKECDVPPGMTFREYLDLYKE